MKKLIFIICIWAGSSNIISAQTIKENIDKAIKDPKRLENEAKADVYIHKNKAPDSVKTKQTGAAREKQKKYKKCRKSK